MRLEDAFAALCPGIPLYAQTPTSLPAGPFAVLSQLTDTRERNYYANADGHAAQQRRVTVLLGVWAGEGWTPERLRPQVRLLRERLADMVSEYADFPPLSGAERESHNLEAGTPTLKRPMFWLRVHLYYIE